ncbi:MAG: hypothetical protein QM763_05810 [Agriterribacter sp.]
MRKLIYSCLLMLFYFHSFAQWNSDPSLNNAISAATSSQINPQIVSNGAGGAVIVWQDNRSGNNDIYAQQIDVNGLVQWTSNGAPVCTATGGQSGPRVIQASTGSYIITWMDSRNGNNDIFAQMINASGVLQWAGDVAICTSIADQTSPQIISDENGGAIIVWQDARDGATDIYAQRVDAAGNALWDANGIPVCNATDVQYAVQIISDGNGGAIAAWADNRSGNNNDIYTQKINADGTSAWTTNGVQVAGTSAIEYLPQLTSDGMNGAIITWSRATDQTDADIYAQYINSAGQPQWAINGIVVCNAANNQLNPRIVTGLNSVFIVWEDSRSGLDGDADFQYDSDIYAQKIDFAGMAEWAANGIIICNELLDQITPELKTDATNSGFFVTWSDARTGAANDIYAQHVSADGNGLLTGNGAIVSSAANIQTLPQLALSEDNAIITWQDMRPDSQNLIYMLRALMH